MAKLCADKSVRTWLTDLKAMTEQVKKTTQCFIETEYKRLIAIGFLEWPQGGPTTWLAEWEDIIACAEQFNVSFPFWLTKVCTIWGRISGLIKYFENVEQDILLNKKGNYTMAAISAAIQFFWKRHKEGTIVKFNKL